MTAPSCPRCDASNGVQVDHPAGRWLCGDCDQLYNGDGIEALAMRSTRAIYLERRDNPKPPAPPMRSWKPERAVPVQQRVKERAPSDSGDTSDT